MRLILRILKSQICFCAPPLDLGTPIGHALLSESSVIHLPRDDFEWAQRFAEGYNTVKLPQNEWRSCLRRIARVYAFAFKKMAQKDGFSQTEDTLTFVVGGKEYTSVCDIPALEDVHTTMGSFSLTQPQLIAIDSCYSNVADNAVVMDALPGHWTAQAVMRDDEVQGFATSLLAVAHESVDGNLFESSFYLAEVAGVAGVDSASCGFFDFEKYPQDEASHGNQAGSFYRTCREALSVFDPRMGCLRPHGIVRNQVGVNSQTFSGDGAYRCFVRKNAENKVIAACLVFDPKHPAFCSVAEEESDAQASDNLASGSSTQSWRLAVEKKQMKLLRRHNY